MKSKHIPRIDIHDRIELKNALPLRTPKKIWDSIVWWNFQQQFLKKERKLMTVLSCPKCGILKQGVPEDLDEFAEEILAEM